MLNPFWIGALLLAAKASFSSYLLVFGSSTLAAFLINANYGIELGIAGALLLLLLSLPRIKKLGSYNFLPVLIFYFCFAPFYLAADHSLNAWINVAVNMAIAVVFELQINRIEEPLAGDGNELLLVLTLVLTSLLFNFWAPIYLIAVYSIALVYCLRQPSKPWKLTYLFISLLAGYFLADLSFEKTVLIIVPLLPAVLFERKSFSLTGFGLASLTLALLRNYKTFYMDEQLYCAIIALLGTLLISDLFPARRNPSIAKLEAVGTLKNHIKNIEEYVSLILEADQDSNLERPSLEANLRIKSCESCGRTNDCDCCRVLAGNLPKPIYKPLKEEVLKNCPNGSKLVYRYRVVSEMVAHELQENLARSEQRSALKTIVEPLKKLCAPATGGEVSLAALNNALGGELLTERTTDRLVSRRALSLEQQQLLGRLINSDVSGDFRFDFLTQTYSYPIERASRFLMSSKVYSFPKNIGFSGDAYSEYKGLDSYEFFQIDAMGHSRPAAATARLALRLLTLSRLEGASAAGRIEELNGILKCKSLAENYVTLDLLQVDLRTGRAELYKYGSGASLFLRGNHVQTIENTLPPVGILQLPSLEPVVLEPQSGDLLLLATDGFERLDEQFVESLKPLDEADPGRQLVAAYRERYTLADDATLTVIRFG